MPADVSHIFAMLRENPADLRQRAEESLRAHCGSHVRVRGLIEFSNICRRNCLYCGLRAQNRGLSRYRMSGREILEAAARAVAQGADTIVLQSGEGACEAAWLGEIVAEIRGELDVPVTLSVGECGVADYELWRKCGASRFLLKHETASADLYARMHPGYTLAARLACLAALKELGYETGGGFMVGLPGQSREILARDLALCADLELDMCGVGPFIPQKDTPLAGQPGGSPQLTLACVSILRILLPKANLPATTALATLDPQKGQLDGLRAGANVLMPSFTPPEFSAGYTIYDNKNSVNMDAARTAIEAAGRSHSLPAAR